MAKVPDREVTVPELLEAQKRIRLQLERLSVGAFVRKSAFARQNKARLTEILEEIEAELAERGYESEPLPKSLI